MTEETYPAIKIPVSRELIGHLFCQSKYPIICEKGLAEGYKCVGVVQNNMNGLFEFLLSREDEHIEGMEFREFMPVFVRKDMMEIQKVKEIIDSVLKWWKEHQFDVVCNEEDEYNVYEDGTKPEFVEIALKIKEDLK